MPVPTAAATVRSFAHMPLGISDRNTTNTHKPAGVRTNMGMLRILSNYLTPLIL